MGCLKSIWSVGSTCRGAGEHLAAKREACGGWGGEQLIVLFPQNLVVNHATTMPRQAEIKRLIEVTQRKSSGTTRVASIDQGANPLPCFVMGIVHRASVP